MRALPSNDPLLALAQRCLTEPPSRALDAEIYCAIHGIEDGNDLCSPALVEAHRMGDVLMSDGWVEAPPFTEDLKYARSLVPDGVHTISRDPRMVCATALSVLALTDAPPLPQVRVLRESWG